MLDSDLKYPVVRTETKQADEKTGFRCLSKKDIQCTKQSIPEH